MISSLELARRCGVSQGTVDRALHDRAGVSPKTREKILRLARQSGYRPHPAVRELLTGQSRMVGAVLPVVNNIFFMDLFNELALALKAQDLQLQLMPVGDRTTFLRALEDCASRRHRLVLAIPPVDDIEVPKAMMGSVPLVSMLSPCLGAGVRFLTADEEKTGRDAVKYLRERGHRRILHLTYERAAYAIRARAEGYRKETAGKGLFSDVLAQVDRKSLAEAIKQDAPTALFCHNDWLAIRAILLLSEMGLRVPEDISVVGVDNSPTLIALQPGLTTLAYPMKAAVQAVLTILEGGKGDLKGARYEVVERRTVRPVRP